MNAAAPDRVVVMTVKADGTMTITVDGLRLLPHSGDWTRESYADVLDHVTAHHFLCVEVQIREADGSVFGELIAAARRRPHRPVAETEATGSGFLPEERVAVAPIGLEVTADREGCVRAPVELRPHRGELSEVVLFGRTSGTIHIAAVP